MREVDADCRMTSRGETNQSGTGRHRCPLYSTEENTLPTAGRQMAHPRVKYDVPRHLERAGRFVVVDELRPSLSHISILVNR